MTVALLRSAEFAALPEVAVSPRQVRYWVKQGMPHTIDPKRPRVLLIDPQAGLRWLTANRTEWTGRGNQRGTTDPQRAGAKERRGSAVRAARQMASEVARYEPGNADASAEAQAMSMLESAGVVDGEETSLTLAKLLACDPAKTVQAKYAAQALRELQQLRKDRGELIEAAPVKRAWVRQAESARRAMAAVGRICASRLRAALSLTTEQQALLRETVDAEVDEALRRLTDDAAAQEDRA